MTTAAAPQQWRRLNKDGGGSTMMVAAPRQRRQPDNNGSLSTTMAAAPRRRRRLHNDGGGSWRRRLHTDWMVVCLKLDGCCLWNNWFSSVSENSWLDFLDNWWELLKCRLLSVSTPPPPITHRPINWKNYGEWGDSVALEIGWLLFLK